MSLSLSIQAQRGNFSLDVQAELPAKGITAIFGPSGSGKTSLLHCLAGLQKCQGSIIINGIDIALLPTKERNIGYVFQEDRLFPHLTVRDNLNFAWQRRINTSGPDLEQISNWLELSDLLHLWPAQLSGGQKKKVAIGRALLSAPQCLLLDEPLTGLDATSGQKITALLLMLSKNLGIPMLYVSHQLNEFTPIADHLLMIEQGRIVTNGPLMEMLTQLELSMNHENDAAVILTGHVKTHDSKHGLTSITIGENQQLWVTHLKSEDGSKVRVRIPAKDVSITTAKPIQTSILNILPATVIDIKLINQTLAVIKTQIAAAEQKVLARITQKSLRQLGLAIGKNVYLQIKTVALLSDSYEK